MPQRELFEELPSTQDRAIELARRGAEEGSVVVARRQSQGRGRGGRRWESPVGGLYLSVVLGPSAAPEMLPLAIGGELAGAVQETYGARLRLKWPNDLVAVDPSGATRKLAGILVDLVPVDPPGNLPVVGIGLNAHRTQAAWSNEVGPRSVALEELSGSAVDLDRLERLVVGSAVDARRALAETNGRPAVLERVRGLLYGLGEAVSVDGRTVGTLQGLGRDGELEVLGPSGPRSIVSGGVQVGVGR